VRNKEKLGKASAAFREGGDSLSWSGGTSSIWQGKLQGVRATARVHIMGTELGEGSLGVRDALGGDKNCDGRTSKMWTSAGRLASELFLLEGKTPWSDENVDPLALRDLRIGLRSRRGRGNASTNKEGGGTIPSTRSYHFVYTPEILLLSRGGPQEHFIETGNLN